MKVVWVDTKGKKFKVKEVDFADQFDLAIAEFVKRYRDTYCERVDLIEDGGEGSDARKTWNSEAGKPYGLNEIKLATCQDVADFYNSYDENMDQYTYQMRH